MDIEKHTIRVPLKKKKDSKTQDTNFPDIWSEVAWGKYCSPYDGLETYHESMLTVVLKLNIRPYP